jgi:hypothetical protein
MTERKRRLLPPPTVAYTINEWCGRERVSRTHLYHLWKIGMGPRYYRVGNQRRISGEASDDWRKMMQAQFGGGA